MYVFGNHIYHKQTACLVYMLQNDLNNGNHVISIIRVQGGKGCRRLVLKVDGHAKVNGSATS